MPLAASTTEENLTQPSPSSTVSSSPMQQIAALPTLLLLLLLAAAVPLPPILPVGYSSVTINATCKAASNNVTSKYDFCVRTLWGDPAGATAMDARALAGVAANLTLANVTSTLLVLADLVHNLGDCLSYYREMNSSVAAAVDDIRAGRGDLAFDKMNSAEHFPMDCDILLFQGSAKKNPMSKENNNANDLANLAYDLTYMLRP